MIRSSPDNTVTCPTCRGDGTIPRETTLEYVALIPLSDRRLQPRRTCVKISGAVLLCLVLFTLLLVFLFPRSIHLHSNGPLIVPTKSVIDETRGTVDMSIEVAVNLTNYNFVAVLVEQAAVTPRYRSTVLGEQIYWPNISVPLRSTRLISVPLSLHFDGRISIVLLCKAESPFIHEVYLDFTIKITSSVLWQPMETTIETMQLVDCSERNIT